MITPSNAASKSGSSTSAGAWCPRLRVTGDVIGACSGGGISAMAACTVSSSGYVTAFTTSRDVVTKHGRHSISVCAVATEIITKSYGLPHPRLHP